MKRPLKLLLVLAVFLLIIVSCTKGNDEKIYKLPTETTTVSAWNVYWDNENVDKELKVLQDSLHEICYFSAYFDSENNLFIPEKVTQTFKMIKEDFKDTSYTHYLSIVNDKINEDGTSTLKDTKLLYELFSSDNQIDDHVNEIINMALENGYDGIEIDYEAIKKDEKLWGLFLDFCERLYEKSDKNNLKMRIVLEPSAPIFDLSCPEGPDYIMMCYNLYGNGTKPGPKADKDFILELVEKMEVIPGKKYFAFATGGFDWEENGKVTPVTEQKANEIMDFYEVTAVRDRKSQCLTFQYVDQNNVNHEIWFADGRTLAFWMETVRRTGHYNFSIWRLNGNNEVSLREIGASS